MVKLRKYIWFELGLVLQVPFFLINKWYVGYRFERRGEINGTKRGVFVTNDSFN